MRTTTKRQQHKAVDRLNNNSIICTYLYIVFPFSIYTYYSCCRRLLRIEANIVIRFRFLSLPQLCSLKFFSYFKKGNASWASTGIINESIVFSQLCAADGKCKTFFPLNMTAYCIVLGAAMQHQTVPSLILVIGTYFQIFSTKFICKMNK